MRRRWNGTLAVVSITLTGALAGPLTACGTTGGNIVTFDVVAQGVTGGSAFDAAFGWHVELSEATLHVGAVYLAALRPASVQGATSCILPPGSYTAEELQPLDVNVLSTSPQPFPGPATGTDDHALTGEVWLTHGDINADADPPAIAQITGTATKGTQRLPFHAEITINSGNRGTRGSIEVPSNHPICKDRIVSPIRIDLRPHDHGTLVITIDPTRWFANVDFAALPPDGELPDDNVNSASQALFTAIEAPSSTFQFSFP